MKRRKHKYKMVSYIDPIERKAKSLARKVLKKDFIKLMKRGYLHFQIKVKRVKCKVMLKEIYLFKSCKLYIRKNKYRDLTRLCSAILPPMADHYSYANGWHEIKYNRYDNLVAFYLWLNHYKTHPVTLAQFQQQFNTLAFDDKPFEKALNDNTGFESFT